MDSYVASSSLVPQVVLGWDVALMDHKKNGIAGSQSLQGLSLTLPRVALQNGFVMLHILTHKGRKIPVSPLYTVTFGIT